MKTKFLMYKKKYHPQVKKDLKKIDPSIRKKIREMYIPDIVSNPRFGEALKGDLRGVYSYHFNAFSQKFRIAYILDEENRTIYIQMIAKRENFYNLLKKRI